jgi:hypothetical protein
MKKRHRSKLLFAVAAISAAGGISLLTVLAQSVPQPVLTITPLGTNQFQIGITNGVTYATYELYWRPVLTDSNYPWQVFWPGSVGQTNFGVDAGSWTSGFFKVSVGTDKDGDGVPDWMDADPNDSTIGALTITIDSPLNGSTFP